MSGDGTTVHFHELLHNVEADAKAAVFAGDHGLQLREHVEDAGQLSGIHAHTLIGHFNAHPPVRARGGEHDPSSAFHVLGSIVQQVTEDLHQTCRITVHPKLSIV